ncbi:unnamed protein product, partial [Prorocentrum cordatum]
RLRAAGARPGPARAPPALAGLRAPQAEAPSARPAASPERGAPYATAAMSDRDGMGPLRHRMFVCGLHRNIPEEEVLDEMSRFGKVLDVKVRSSVKDTFAFVQFGDSRSIERAIEELNDSRGSPLGDTVSANFATADSKRGGGSDWADGRGGGGRWGGGGDRREDGDRGRGGDWSRRDWDRGDRRQDDWPPRPPPPARWEQRRGRSRSLPRESWDSGRIRQDSSVPQGRYKIRVENLPDDMTWIELKEISREFGGNSLTFTRTFRARDVNTGIVEFSDRRDSDRLMRELDGRRMQGSDARLAARPEAGYADGRR